MKISPKSISNNTAFKQLYNSLKDNEYESILYELDCEPASLKYSISLETVTTSQDKLITYYPECNIDTSYIGIFTKPITRQHFIDNTWKISQWGKIQVICEKIEGTLRGVVCKENALKILVSVPSFSKTLATLHIEDSTAILEEVRDYLYKPYIMVWLTIPSKGYDITELGVECRWSSLHIDEILRRLQSLDLISKEVYHHIKYNPEFNLDLKYYKIVFKNGKITESKLYFSPKN